MSAPPATPASPREAALVSALPEELSPLLRRARARRIGASLWRGSLGGRAVVLACTGDGPRNAERGLVELLEPRAVDVVIGLGAAGGLSPGLPSGELVVARLVRDGHGLSVALDPEWTARALACGARPASLVSVDRVITSRREKASLAACLGPTDAAAVDMEAFWWAATARRHGVPCVVVRAICDTHEEELPILLADCVGASGGIDRGRIALRLLCEPRAVPAVLRLRSRVRDGAERLAALVESLVCAAPDRAAQG